MGLTVNKATLMSLVSWPHLSLLKTLPCKAGLILKPVRLTLQHPHLPGSFQGPGKDLEMDSLRLQKILQKEDISPQSGRSPISFLFKFKEDSLQIAQTSGP